TTTVTVVVVASIGGLPTVTVTLTLPAASAALTTLSPAIVPTVTLVSVVSGAVVSGGIVTAVQLPAAEPVLPAGSVRLTSISPLGWAAGAVTLHSPVSPSAVTCDVVPSGHVISTRVPGSVVPEAVGALSPLGSSTLTVVVGGVTSISTGPRDPF